MTNNKYWIFLEKLRRSEVINMYGAAPFIMREFAVDENTAGIILSNWMENYNPEDYKENVN